MQGVTLGLDIGGANLKAATANRFAVHWPFALWRDPEGLSTVLRQLVAQFPEQPIERFAITMTGEMCDCFATKREGVDRILQAVEIVAAGRPIWVWLVGSGFASVADARGWPLQAAASNWHGLATFASRFSRTRTSLLIDIGSTTTDIIPIVEGVPSTAGRDDAQRFRVGELVYTGVGRTPVSALLGSQVMAELFATSRDAYLILKEVPEDSSDTNTADGRPATRTHARTRMARLIGGDAEHYILHEVEELAESVQTRQRSMIVEGLHKTCRSLELRSGEFPETVIFSGAGEFLARAAWSDYLLSLNDDRTASIRTVSLGEAIGSELSQSACAYALAVLAQERSW